ncbi:PqqD family protein [Candidatus Bipolaricaulota bacterium]
MVKESERVTVRGPHVVGEIIEGEAIIINLESGSYYSLQDAGAEIWAGVQEGIQVREIVDRLRTKYLGDDECIRRSAMALLEQLEAEALITYDAAGARVDTADDVPGAKSPEGLPFSPPVLHTYTDMQELLLVDPIHEIDPSGWPQPPTNDTESGE